LQLTFEYTINGEATEVDWLIFEDGYFTVYSEDRSDVGTYTIDIIMSLADFLDTQSTVIQISALSSPPYFEPNLIKDFTVLIGEAWSYTLPVTTKVDLGNSRLYLSFTDGILNIEEGATVSLANNETISINI
jgi:hypothetical protein